MEKYIVTTGKTIELAIEAALQQLKLDRDSVSVEVLRNAKSGFLGIGSSPAEVKVTYEAPDEAPAAPKSALSSASRSKPKEKPDLTPSVISRPGKAVVPAESKKRTEKKDRPERKPMPKKEAPKKDAPKPESRKEAPKSEPKAAKKDYAPAAAGSIEEKIEHFPVLRFTFESEIQMLTL